MVLGSLCRNAPLLLVVTCCSGMYWILTPDDLLLGDVLKTLHTSLYLYFPCNCSYLEVFYYTNIIEKKVLALKTALRAFYIFEMGKSTESETLLPTFLRWEKTIEFETLTVADHSV